MRIQPEKYVTKNVYPNGDTLIRVHLFALVKDAANLDFRDINDYCQNFCSHTRPHDVVIRITPKKQIFIAQIIIEEVYSNDTDKAFVNLEAEHAEMWDLDYTSLQQITDDNYDLLCGRKFTKKINNKKFLQNSFSAIEDLINKTINSTLPAYLKKVLFMKDKDIKTELNKSIDEIYEHCLEYLEPFINIDIIQISALKHGDLPLECYNKCLLEPRLVQLLELAPALAHIYGVSHMPYQNWLDKPIDYQLRQILRLPSDKNVGAIKYYVTHCNFTDSYSIVFGSDKEMIKILNDLSNADVNHMRRFKKPIEWTIFNVALKENIDFANILVADPEFHEVILEHSNNTQINNLRAAVKNMCDMYEDAVRQNPLRKFKGIKTKTLWIEQEEWHRRMQIVNAQKEAAYRAEHYDEMVSVTFPDPPMRKYTEEYHEEEFDEKEVYCLKYLDNELDLYDEGKMMRHCVHGYHISCADGKKWIYSLQDLGGYHIATVEFDQAGKQVLQARGTLNVQLVPDTQKRLEKLVHDLHKPEFTGARQVEGTNMSIKYK